MPRGKGFTTPKDKPTGRHTHWAATIIGSPEHLKQLKANTTIPIDSRECHFIDVGSIEFGSKSSTQGVFSHVHCLLRIHQKGKRTQDTIYYSPLLASLKTYLSTEPFDMHIPYLYPCKDPAAWIKYSHKTETAADQTEAFVMDLLRSGVTDHDAISAKVYTQFGLNEAVKYSRIRLKVLTNVAKQSAANVAPYDCNPVDVMHAYWDLFTRADITLPIFTDCTEAERLLFTWHLFILFLYVPRITNTPDGYPAIFLSGPPKTGKSSLFLFANRHMIPVDAKGVVKYYSSKPVFGFDDIQPATFSSNREILRQIILGQEARIKISGATVGCVGKWFFATSNDLLYDVVNGQAADIRRFINIEVQPFDDDIALHCDPVQLKRIMLSNYAELIQTDLWCNAPFASHLRTKFYTELALEALSNLSFD